MKLQVCTTAPSASCPNAASVDVIIPCYNGIHCNNFLFEKFQLTPKLYFAQAEKLVNNSHKSNTSYWYNGAFYLKDYSNVGVVAGHFRWQVWLHLESYVQQYMTPINATMDTSLSTQQVTASSFKFVPADAIPPPKCMVIGRHPIARFISYYYQRCFGSSSCFGK